MQHVATQDSTVQRGAPGFGETARAARRRHLAAPRQNGSAVELVRPARAHLRRYVGDARWRTLGCVLARSAARALHWDGRRTFARCTPSVGARRNAARRRLAQCNFARGVSRQSRMQSALQSAAIGAPVAAQTKKAKAAAANPAGAKGGGRAGAKGGGRAGATPDAAKAAVDLHREQAEKVRRIAARSAARDVLRATCSAACCMQHSTQHSMQHAAQHVTQHAARTHHRPCCSPLPAHRLPPVRRT